MSRNKLSLALYRSLSRLEKNLVNVSQTISTKHEIPLNQFLRKEAKFLGYDDECSEGCFRSHLRKVFLENADVSEEELTIKQQKGFNYLQLFSSRVKKYENKKWIPRDPTLKFHIGQIVQDRQTKLVGVIIGYELNYENKSSRQKMNFKQRLRRRSERGFSQPFYTILFEDCEREVVPEDLLNLYTKKDFESIILENPDLERYFEKYCPELTIFVPNEALRQSYPDD